MKKLRQSEKTEQRREIWNFVGNTGDNLSQLILILFRPVLQSCDGVGVVVRYGTGKRSSAIADAERPRDA